MERTYDELMSELSECESAYEKLQKDNDFNYNKAQALEKAYAELDEKKNKLMLENRNLERELATLNDEMQKRLHYFNSQNRGLREVNAQLVSNINSLATSLRVYQALVRMEQTPKHNFEYDEEF